VAAPATELDVLNAKLDALSKLVDERDRLYKERDEARTRAVDAALKAAEVLTNAAFASSEKAIAKAEENSEKWRANANEWRNAMNDRELKFAPRMEMDQRIRSLEEKIGDLKTTQAQGGGAREGGKAVKDESRANVAILLSAVVGLIAVVTLVLRFSGR
jgi:hypothetical protein